MSDDLIAHLRRISAAMIADAALSDGPLRKQIKKQNAKAIADAAAELTRLRAKVDAADKLAEALAFYADLSAEGPWHLPSEDYGKRARAALSAYEATREPQPTEYEIKLAQLKKDFPNGI